METVHLYVSLPQDQRPNLTYECRGGTTCKRPGTLATSPREGRNVEPWEKVGGRRTGKGFVFKGAIGETESMFPSPAENQGYSLLGKWLTLFSWFEGCFQALPQSSPSPHCSSQSNKSTGNATLCPRVPCHP